MSQDLETKTNEQLKDIIRKYNLTHHIRGYSKMKKADLISSIRKHMKPVEQNINIEKKEIKPVSKTLSKEVIEQQNKYSDERYYKLMNDPNYQQIEDIRHDFKMLYRNELGETKKEKIKYENELIEKLKSIKNKEVKNEVIKAIEDYYILDKANMTPPLKKAIQEFIKPEPEIKTKIITSKQLDQLLGKYRL